MDVEGDDSDVTWDLVVADGQVFDQAKLTHVVRTPATYVRALQQSAGVM